MIVLLLRVLAITVPTAVALLITFYSCREMRRLLKAKIMKRWEVGFFSGWLIGGTIFYFVAAVLSSLYPHAEWAVWRIADFSMWKILMFSFGTSLYVTGPIGIATAYFPWQVFASKRKPKILGCGKHGRVRTRLVMLPNSRSNDRELIATGCKTVLKVSRERWKERLCVPRQVEPPPLTRRDWQIIYTRLKA
jgi:MFS family permease